MSRRPSSETMRNGLKLATRLSLTAAGGAAALVRERLVRVGEAALSFACSPHVDHEERFVALDVALDLDFLAGEPLHARALAAAQGYELRLLERSASAGVFGHSDIRNLTREFADLQDTMFAALDDGTICRKDREAILAELADVERMAAAIRAKVEASA
ncbi:hypothetical protein [Aureimonas phyllosphaerae]|uniref:Uncharacterized protein n=1 Tax=Aureimonas phyllosphaerae TaxID=1166078 RepID=A0A7W6BTT6_9HYPH|nr:hypothetical protein [Aureimonas phyllosphaerae]MBB3937913.1 hypothetical protein [Aureimonas phyllosphaerae]MBB3961914.1 hypothetical protein [Aureimonas phyllosphaerae]SFF54659.1 hypothetical protein SAMN05216566_12541 [Aureimonas phyllosphaerae]